MHKGSSGGPVVDKDGKVFGINCLSMDPYTDVSFVTPINYIMNAFVDDVRFGEMEAPNKVILKELIDLGHIALR